MGMYCLYQRRKEDGVLWQGIEKKQEKGKNRETISLKPVLTAAVCMIIFKILLIPVTTWKGFGYLLLPFSLYLVWFALWQAVIPGIVSGKAGVKLRMGKVSALQRMAVQWLLCL